MASKTQRGFSPKSPTRRPKLMRASVTAPSLATSNASRNDLASWEDYRAATLLTRVASYSSATHQQSFDHTHAHRSSLGSICSSPGGERSAESVHMERKEPFEIAISQCGNYFSFPSFEDFQEYRESEEGIDGAQEQRV